MKTPGPVLAFDRASVRRYDDDGRLHVAITNISKANVCQYYGSEIPQWQSLGLDAQKVYRLLRDPAALEAAAPTFNNVPLQLKHVHQKASDPQSDLIVGSISGAVFVAPFLSASLCVWHEQGIAAIETETMVELSASYHYDAVMEPGEFEGEAYDGKMTNIRGNHVALVEEGRAGPDVLVADSNPFTNKQETPAMKTKLGRALIAALSAASPKIAQDSSLGALVGEAKKKTFNKSEVKKQLLAMDSEVDMEQLDELLDAIMGVQESPEPEKPAALAGDEDDDGAGSKHAEIIDFLKSKGLDASDLEAVGNILTRMDGPEKPAATDEDPSTEGFMKEEDVNTAMDAMRKEFRDLEQAKADVRPTVGDVIGMDSAPSVYRFALDQMKVDHKDLPDDALGKFYALAADRKSDKSPSTLIANDSAIVATIKGLDRFS